ncbi:MAG TPA: hypothetical protein PKC43_01805 [Phycisphaerales bacterium]|nr:hypothetical protein [Phycisphaerales bacterium]HMP36160.1 hypothetical protein [Phycisphaerales bacterium]
MSLALVAAVILSANPVAGIGPGAVRPTILRGGVLVLPLVAERPGGEWPGDVELRFEGGRSITARTAWIHRAPPRAVRRWTDEPRGLAIRPIAPSDGTAESLERGAPFAVVRFDPETVGDFHVVDPRVGAVPDSGPGAIPVRPIWYDRALLDADQVPDESVPELPRVADFARPDPDSPFDYWRWVLLAQRHDLRPPPPPGDELERLVALHGAELWRIGLARLAAQSAGVAASCREALTNTCMDGAREIAAWVTDPLETEELLATLLDTGRRNLAMMERALAWAESREPFALWIERCHGTVVQLAVANPSVRELAVRTAWIGPTSLSLVRTVPPLTVGHLAVHRPALPGERATLAPPRARSEPRELPTALQVESLGARRTLQVPPAVEVAVPPGFPLPTFRPPLRLGEARSGVQQDAPRDRTTAGVLRRVNRRWELFVECARAPIASAAPSASGLGSADLRDPSADTDRSEAATEGDPPLDSPAGPPSQPPSGGPVGGPVGERVGSSGQRHAQPPLRETVSGPVAAARRLAGDAPPAGVSSFLPLGEEALVVVLGPDGPGQRVLVVPEEGPARLRVLDADGMQVDAPLPGDLEVHRRSLEALWRCRLVLPHAWLPVDGAPLVLAMARTHGTDAAVETCGLPCVPWAVKPAPLAIDLSRWGG